MKKRRKIKVKSFIILFIFVALIIGIFIFLSNGKNKESLNESDLKIELIGDKEITIEYGEEYNDQGAKAYYKDEDISNDIVTNNNIDLENAGTYKVTYKIKYKELSKEEERLVTVLEQKKPTIEVKNGITYIDGILIANKSYSLPSSYNPGGLLKEFTDNFNKMQADAASVGISLKVISGFRSYERQASIYNNYVKERGQGNADAISARPGHSEHQTGLAADINSLSQAFENTKEGKWLNDNCYKYGFIIRYVKGKEDITGYIFEPWHIRYVGNELAEKLYNNGNWITLEEYFGIDSKYS